MLPVPGPVYIYIYILRMIRDRHVILKVVLHIRLYSCLVAASYIIMLCCLVYSYHFLMLVGELIITGIVI